jgi:hypothetical protein
LIPSDHSVVLPMPGSPSMNSAIRSAMAAFSQALVLSSSAALPMTSTRNPSRRNPNWLEAWIGAFAQRPASCSQIVPAGRLRHGTESNSKERVIRGGALRLDRRAPP